MPTFGDVAESTDNNFHAVRLVAAGAVFLSHCFALAAGGPSPEPLKAYTGYTLGTIAVHVFFVASGYLVTGSLLVRAGLREFLLARALRIYPALWCSLALTVLACGLGFSELSAAEFFRSPGTWRFLARNAGAVLNMSFELPGVFASNPYPKAVNGSLWTLPIEARLYLALSVGAFAVARLRIARLTLRRLCIAVVATLLPWVLVGLAKGADVEVPAMSLLFASGSALRHFQDRVSASSTLAAAIAAAWLVAMAAGTVAFEIVYTLTLPWLVLWLALVPKGPWRRLNQVGDYSYGLYIYAFPLQQMMAARLPHATPLHMFTACVVPLALIAVASWHGIEHPALQCKPTLFRLLARQPVVRAGRPDDAR